MAECGAVGIAVRVVGARRAWCGRILIQISITRFAQRALNSARFRLASKLAYGVRACTVRVVEAMRRGGSTLCAHTTTLRALVGQCVKAVRVDLGGTAHTPDKFCPRLAAIGCWA